MNINAFKKDLIAIINAHSMENGSDTPDFILADYLVSCLETWNSAVEKRERWYDRLPRESGGTGGDPDSGEE